MTVEEVSNEIILTHPARRLYLLIERYKESFHGTGYGLRRRGAIPTPIVCACERGHVDDVELFMNLHPFHSILLIVM